MALINEHYVFVETENVDMGVTVSEHPVEKGINITDNVKKNAVTISIKGEIVGENAKSVKDTLCSLHQNGKLVKYIGVNTLDNAIITVFKTENTYQIKGGYSFEAEIRQVRIASSAYQAKAPNKKSVSGGQQQVTEKKKTKTRYYTVKAGDCLWSIAKSYYGDGSKYMKIFEANKDKIKDPDLIIDGWKLVIPY